MPELETRIATAASQSAALQAYFGTGVPSTSGFRWFDVQIPQNAISKGTCARVDGGIGEDSIYVMEGRMPLGNVRVQVDILDPSVDTARAAAAAVQAWFGTVDFSGTSPAAHSPNIKINARSGVDFKLGFQLFVETLEYRIWNKEN